MGIWKKISALIAKAAVLLTALYFGFLIAVPYFVDLNKYKEAIFLSVEKSAGFKISCEDISFKRNLSPYLKIHLYHTLVFYPDDEVFLRLKEADLQIKILPLLVKNIVIKDVKLTRPIINITLYKDFSTSLEKYIDISKTINTNGFKFVSLINDTICTDYKIKFKDESVNKTFYFEGSSLILKDLKLNDKAHIILKGSLFENNQEYINYDIDIISAFNSGKKHFTFSPFKTILESNVKGNVFGHLKIDKENKINGSLKINDLSLKLNNVTSKNNTANLNFNGDEAEIISKLHTSLNDSAEINGKFSFGKKKYIDLNTNAKNIEIENLIKIVSEISRILNIKNPLSEIKGKGLLDAEFNINSDFKKLKSSGHAEIINASLTHKLMPYSITDINASCSLDNNKISIKNAAAKINNTPINLKGVINEDVSFDINAFSENLDFVNIINFFGLNNKFPVDFIKGRLSFDSNISGILNNFYNVKSKINLTGINFKDKTYNTPVQIKSAVINFSGNNNKFSGEILCGDVSSKYSGKNIIMPELKLTFDENKIVIPENTVTTPVTLILSGEINNYLKTPEGNIKFKGEILSDFIADNLKSNVKFPYKAEGKIHAQGLINYTEDKLNLKAKFNADKNNYLSYVVIKELLNKPSVLNIDCDITGKTLEIKDMSLCENINSEKTPSVISIAGEIKKEKNPVLKNLKITIPNPITIAANFFGGEEISFNADLLLNKSILNPEIKGNMKIFKYNIKKFLTSLKDADINFNTENIRITAPNVIVNDSSFNVIADIMPAFDIKNIIISNLQINSLNLDLNSLYSTLTKENNTSLLNMPAVKKGILTINDFKVLDLKAKDISSDIQIEKNIIKLSNIEAHSYNGIIEGNINYNIAKSIIDMNITGKKLDIKTSLYDLCKIQDDIKGKYDFTAKMSMIIGKYNEVIKSMNGNVKFSAYDGKMGTLGKFEYYLYAQNLLYHGLLNATLNRIADTIVRDNTAEYKTADGLLLFQNGYILTEGITSTGINMSLYMKGKHNLITNLANIDIFGRISDEVKSKLGSFGNTSISEIINGSEDKKNVKAVTIPYAIAGKIPYLYNQKENKTNLFKVNICGNINSLSSINSFVWIISNDNEKTVTEEKLPDFSDMLKDNL